MCKSDGTRENHRKQCPAAVSGHGVVQHYMIRNVVGEQETTVTPRSCSWSWQDVVGTWQAGDVEGGGGGAGLAMSGLIFTLGPTL